MAQINIDDEPEDGVFVASKPLPHKIIIGLKGSSTSGNFGHAGRPGRIGGSVSKRGLAVPDDPRGQFMPITDDPNGLNSTDPNATAALQRSHDELNNNTYDEAGNYKDTIVSELSAATGIPYVDVNDFVHQWAVSSNDTTYMSLSIQEAVAAEMGVPLSKWQEQKIRDLKYAEQIKPIIQRKLNAVNAEIEQHNSQKTAYYNQAMEAPPGSAAYEKLMIQYHQEHKIIDTLAEQKRAPLEARISELNGIIHTPKGEGVRRHIFQNRLDPEGDARRLVRAMYDAQQARFAAKGITSVKLYRGTQGISTATKKQIYDLPNNGRGAAISIFGNAAESWSAKYETAHGFGGSHGVTLGIRVPVSRILTSAASGLGCLGEQEFVLLGSKSSVKDMASVLYLGFEYSERTQLGI